MREAPSTGFLEIAAEALKSADKTDWIRVSTLKQFNSFGEDRKAEIIKACGGDPLTAGYLLGLETARALLATIPAAVKAGVSI